MTYKQIISEIKSALKTYDQQGLLDEISIRNWIKENIKEFGGNIMNEYQTVLIVEKGKVKLPDNFWALKAAIKCEQEGYTEEKVEKHIQKRISYLEWTDIEDYYNYIEGRPCLEDGDSKYVTETLYFEVPKKAYKFYYKQPKILNLKNHVYQVRCEDNCPNLNNNSEFESILFSKLTSCGITFHRTTSNATSRFQLVIFSINNTLLILQHCAKSTIMNSDTN